MTFIKVPADQVENCIYDCNCPGHGYHVRPRETLLGFSVIPLNILDMTCMPESQMSLIQSLETVDLQFSDFASQIIRGDSSGGV